MRLAGVDIGTLTCRLLIARVTHEGRVVELHAERRVLRLGEGLERDRMLRPAPMSRVVDTLRQWRETIESYGVDAEAAVATSAVREATNREEFLARAKQEAGFDVEVITGEEEARRTLLGIRSGLPSDVSGVLGLDIGGGSTEFILDRPGQPPAVQSIELGVVRMTERELQHDPPTREELRAVREQVRGAAEQVRARLGDLRGTTLVGTAGTITTLAAMAQRLPSYSAARIHNYRLGLDTIRSLEDRILQRTRAERKGMPGLEAGREDVIAAGTLMLRGIMETLAYDECLVSDLGLREGIVLDLAKRLQ